MSFTMSARRFAPAFVVLVGTAAPVPATPAPPDSAAWAACAGGAAATTVLRRYVRHSATDRSGHLLPPGTAQLSCGTRRYGYRHILTRHQDDWSRGFPPSAERWDERADRSIAATLLSPDAVSYRVGNDGWCYSRTLEFRGAESPRASAVRVVRVVVTGAGGTVVTAYPADEQCSGPGGPGPA